MNKAAIKYCTYPGCLVGIGKWKPIVVVKSPDNDKTFEFDFQHCTVCETHKPLITLESIIGGQVFPKLINMFSEKFIHPPKKEHCSLRWEPLNIPIFCKGAVIGNVPVNFQ